MTDESRKERREFIHRLRALMHRKNVTQIVLACHLRIGDKHLGACMDEDRDNHFPTHLLGRCVSLLGPEIFACIPGCESFIVTAKPEPIANVEPVSNACIPVLREAGELVATAMEAVADGRVTHAEQADIDRATGKLQRSSQTLRNLSAQPLHFNPI